MKQKFHVPATALTAALSRAWAKMRMYVVADSWELGFSAGRADALKVEHVEGIEGTPFGQPMAHLGLLDIPLVLCGETRRVNENLELPAGAVEDGKLGRRRRRMAADAPDTDAVSR